MAAHEGSGVTLEAERLRERLMETRRKIERLTSKMPPEVAAPYFERVDADLEALAVLEGRLAASEERLRAYEGQDTHDELWYRLQTAEGRLAEATEALRDAREVLGKFEWLPSGATITRHWEPTGDPNGSWVSRAEVAREVGQSETFTCATCGHHEPVHEPGCSMRSVLDGKPALRLRHRREALRTAT